MAKKSLNLNHKKIKEDAGSAGRKRRETDATRILLKKVIADFRGIVRRDQRAGLAQQKLVKEKFEPLVKEILRKKNKL